MLAIGHARISFNSIEWIHRQYSMEGGHVASFNSIEWILHHLGSCTLWKSLSSPLYGFYSIKPPGGGSIYMV